MNKLLSKYLLCLNIYVCVKRHACVCVWVIKVCVCVGCKVCVCVLCVRVSGLIVFANVSFKHCLDFFNYWLVSACVCVCVRGTAHESTASKRKIGKNPTDTRVFSCAFCVFFLGKDCSISFK